MFDMFDMFINLIPSPVRDTIRDRIVDTLANVSSDDRWRKLLKSFRSDAEFQSAFDMALGRALQRFTHEYNDQGLVEALAQTRFWNLPQVQKVLVDIVTRPSSYLNIESTILSHSFTDTLPTVNPELFDQALRFFLSCLGDEVINIPQLAPIYQIQFQKISLEQARQMVASIQALQRDQRQLLTAILDNISQIPLGLAPPSDQPTQLASKPQSKILFNLPARYGVLLGREKDIARVLEGLDSRYPLIAIEGMAGIGKTTLAIEAAYSCLPASENSLSSPFEVIAWVSARDQPEQKQWLNEVLDTTAGVLGYPAITQMPPEQKPLEIDQLLRNRRTLIIVDNFETVEDPALVAWIQRVPEPSKALITTRHGQTRRAWDIHLEGLERSEALELVRKNARRLGLHLIEKASEDLLLPLLQVTEGNPKAIEMAIGYLKEGGRLSLDELVNHLYAASKTVGGLFDGLFSRFWNKVLSEDAKNILMVSSFFVNSASKEALEAASGLTGYRLDVALELLVDLALLDINPEWVISRQRHYSIHPLTRAFANAKLYEAPTFEKKARIAWSNYYVEFSTRKLVREKSPERYWNTLTSYDVLKFVDPEWSNLQQVLIWADQNDEDRLLIELTILLVHYMGNRLLFPQRIYYVQRAANAAHSLGLKEDEALFRIDGLGWIFIEECNYNNARQEIMAGKRLAESIDNGSSDAINLIALANTTMATMFLEQGDIEKATEFMSMVDVTLCKPVIQHRAYTIAGNIAQEKNNNQEAISLYEDAIILGKQYSGEGMGFEWNYRLGLACLANGDLERAESMFNTEAFVSERAGPTVTGMYAKYGQASVARAKGERDKALQLVRNTREELTRLVNSHRLLNQLDAFLQSLEAE